MAGVARADSRYGGRCSGRGELAPAAEAAGGTNGGRIFNKKVSKGAMENVMARRRNDL